MPRGGARKNAGRKAGGKNKPKAIVLEPAWPEGEIPLDYMLRLMRSRETPPDRRDALAIRALPFTAQRNAPADGAKAAPAGKKAAAAAAAHTAAEGTDWQDLV